MPRRQLLLGESTADEKNGKRELISDIWGKRGAAYGEKGCVSANSKTPDEIGAVSDERNANEPQHAERPHPVQFGEGGAELRVRGAGRGGG